MDHVFAMKEKYRVTATATLTVVKRAAYTMMIFVIAGTAGRHFAMEE